MFRTLDDFNDRFYQLIDIGSYLFFETNRKLLRSSIVSANSVNEATCCCLSEIKSEVDFPIFSIK